MIKIRSFIEKLSKFHTVYTSIFILALFSFMIFSKIIIKDTNESLLWSEISAVVGIVSGNFAIISNLTQNCIIGIDPPDIFDMEFPR